MPIQLGFGPFGPGLHGLGVARRQIELYEAPRIADHHFTQQRSQPVTVQRVARVAALDVLLLEIGFGAQMARGQEREQVVELEQVVLHGRRGKKEHEPPLQRIDELPVEGRAVLAVVGLVDDDQVPGFCRYQRRPLLRFHERQRRQNTVVPPPEFGPVDSDSPWRDGKVQVELGDQFFMPLRNEW